MLTGKLPFNGTAAQVVTAHLIQELPDITELNEECPESLEAVIRKMTGKSPDERYQSMDEVIDSLEFVQKEVYGEIIVDYPKKRKPILLTVLIILVVLLIGAGVGLYFMGILDPIIAEITGKTAAITDDGTKPTSNGNGIKTTNGHETQNGNGNNGTHQKTPAEIAAEKLKLENEKKQKRFINEAQNIIGAITTGFWTDISGNVKRIDKEKFEEYEKQFLDLLKKIEDETDRFNLNSKFYVQKSICSEKWVSIAKDIAKEKLAEFIKKLQNIRTDTTTTLEDINDNLQKIDNFVIELPESASELDKFKIDLEKIKTNIEKLISLKEKSKDENDLQVLLNYLVVLGEIVNVDGKAYKFEDRDDVKGYKYALTRTFEDQMMKRYADIAKMAAKSELDTLQKLVDDYALLVILNPKEKEKYKFVTQSIETRRKEIERNEKIKELKERLIQQIDESLIEQDLEKMQSLRRQINRQEEDYPEIFDDKVFREWLNKLDDMVEHRKVEEEELANVRAGIKKLTDRCNDIDIKDKSKIEDVRILKTDIDEYLEKNKELLENTKLKDEKTNLHDVRLKCIEYLSIHTVEIYNTDDNENIPWQLKKACSFKGALFNLRLEKIYSDFSWRQPAKITCMEYVKTRNAEYIITGSIDKTVRLWDYKTLTEVRILRNEAAVTALAYRISKNNEIKIFAGLKDGTIAVWNPIYSKVNNFSTIHTSAVTSIVVLNNIALSTSEDKTVVGWSYKDETLNLKGEVLEPEELNRTGITIKHPDVVFQVDVSADRNYFATACGDQKIRIYSMNGALKTTIKGFFGAVYSVSFEPTEGKLIAAGGEENAVKIFRIENGESFAEFKGHKHYITNVKYNSQGRLVSTSLDNKSILWNVEKQEPEIEYLSKLPNTDFVFTSDNQIIFSQWDGGFSKFRINNGQKIPNSNVGHTNSITGVFKTHNGEIITTSIDGKVLFWSNEEISKPTEFSLVMPSSADNGTKNEDKNNENIPITAFSADSSGKYGVFGRLDESVFLVDFTKKTVVKYWDLKENISSVGVILMQNDDSFEVVCIIGTKGGQVFVKSLNDTINKQFKVKGNTVSSINTTNTGLVAVAGYSSEVVIYNLHLKMIESTIDSSVSNSIVTSLDMSNDGNIAIGYKEQDMGVVRVYKIASKELVTTYSNLEISVVSLHFILNSTTILAIDGAANVKAFKINEDGSNLENFSANIGFCGDIITSTFINSDFGLIIFGTARGAVLSYKIETE